MELKIPPPLLILISVLIMWSLSKVSFLSLDYDFLEPLSIMVFVIGLAIDLLAIFSFQKAKTTINPMKPARTAKLVQSGIYSVSRNPMYLGALFILIACATWLGSLLNIAVLIFFVWYIKKYQITPEEKTLKELFPEEFERYKSNVKRWI